MTESAHQLSETLQRLGAQFRAELPSRIAQAHTWLQACQASPDDDAALQALFLMLHSLAGTAGTFGLHELGMAARNAELATEPLLERHPRTPLDFAPLRLRLHALAACLPQPGGPAPTPPEPA